MATENIKYVLRAQDRTKAAFNSVKRNLGGLQKALRAVRVAAVAFLAVMAARAVAGFIGGVVRAGDQLDKLRIRLGASTEALSEYRLLAERSGVAFETLTMGLQRMVRRISEAAQGSGEAKDALKELGLSAQLLNRMKPSEQFEILADRLMAVENQADRVRLAMRLFDSEGVALLQTMEGGARAIRGVRQEARELNSTLTRAQVQALARANNAWTDLKRGLVGLGEQIVATLIPRLTGLLTWLERIVKYVSGPVIRAFKVMNQGLIEIGRGIDWVWQKGKDFLRSLGLARDEVMIFGGEIKAWTGLLDGARKALDELNLSAGRLQVNVGGAGLPALDSGAERAFKAMQAAEKARQAGIARIRDEGRALRETLDPQVRYNNELARLKVLYEAGELSQAQFFRGQQLVARQFFEQKRALEETLKGTRTLDRANIDLAQTLRGPLDTALQGQIQTWEDLRSVALRALSDILQAQLRVLQAAQQGSGGGGFLGGLLDNLFNSGGGSNPAAFTAGRAGPGGLTFGASGPGFGGGRAAGGPVAAGRSYLVGERGPEILTMGRSSGFVTPNHRLGGGVTNYFAIDARGAERGVEERIEAALRRVLPGALRRTEDNAVARVAEENRRNPRYLSRR